MSGNLENKDSTLDIREITASLLLPFEELESQEGQAEQQDDPLTLERVLIAAMDEGQNPLLKEEKEYFKRDTKKNQFWTTLSKNNYLEPTRSCLVITIQQEKDDEDTKFTFLDKTGYSKYCYEPFGTGDGKEHNYYAHPEAMKLLFQLFHSILSKDVLQLRDEMQKTAYTSKLEKYPRDVEKLVIALDEILITIFKDQDQSSSTDSSGSQHDVLFTKVTELIKDEMGSEQMKTRLDTLKSPDVKTAFEETKAKIEKISSSKQVNGYVYLFKVFQALCPLRLQLLDKSTLLPVVARALIMHSLTENKVRVPHMENCLRLLTQNDSKELLRTNTLQVDQSLIATVNRFHKFFQYQKFILNDENTLYHYNFSQKQGKANDFESMCIELEGKNVDEAVEFLKKDKDTNQHDFLNLIKTNRNFQNALILTDLVLFPSIKAILKYSILEMQQKPIMLANLYQDVYALLKSNKKWQKEKNNNKRETNRGKASIFKKSKEKVEGTSFINSDKLVHGFCEILASVAVREGQLKRDQFHKNQAFKTIIPKNYGSRHRGEDTEGFYGQYLTGLKNTGRTKNVVENEELMTNYWGNHNIALIVYEKTSVTINPILGYGCKQFEKRLSGGDSGQIDEMLFFSRFCWNPNTVETIKNLTNDSVQDTRLKQALEDDTFTKTFFSAMNHTYRQSIHTMTMVQKTTVIEKVLDEKDRVEIFQILSSLTLIHLPNWIINILQDQEIRNKTNWVYKNLLEKGLSIHIDSSLDKEKDKTFTALRACLGKKDDKIMNDLLRPLHLLDMCMFAILVLFKDDKFKHQLANQPRNKEMLEQKGWKYFIMDLGFSTQSFVNGEANPLSQILNDVLNHIIKFSNDDDDGDDDEDDDDIAQDGTNAHAETFLFRDIEGNPIDELQIFENILVVGSKGKKKKAKIDKSDQGSDTIEELEPADQAGVAQEPEEQNGSNVDPFDENHLQGIETADFPPEEHQEESIHNGENPTLNEDTLQNEIVEYLRNELLDEMDKQYEGTFCNFLRLLVNLNVGGEMQRKLFDYWQEGVIDFFEKYELSFQEEVYEDESDSKPSSMPEQEEEKVDSDHEKDENETVGVEGKSTVERKQKENMDGEGKKNEEQSPRKKQKKDAGGKRVKLANDSTEKRILEEEEKEEEKTLKKQKIKDKTPEELEDEKYWSLADFGS